MKFKLQLVVSPDDSNAKVIDLLTISKETTALEDIGLTLADSKELLKCAQYNIIHEQIYSYLSSHSCCSNCGNTYHLKGHNTKQLKTLFGCVTLDTPRFYSCHCQGNKKKSFSPLTELLTVSQTPELLYIEAKYASLMSYGLTTKVLSDFLPIDNKLNAATIRNHTLNLAKQSEEMLGDERYFFADISYSFGKPLKTNSIITMGIDGGYLRQWENKKKNFEVIAGKSIPQQGKTKYFGLVQSVDKKPKRRVYDVLVTQQMQDDRLVEFLSDGADNVRELQRFLSPLAKHILDWFHISMRFTVLTNYAKGYQKYDEEGINILKELESAKWHLWHGHAEKCYEMLEDVSCFMNEDSNYPYIKQFEKVLDETMNYIYRNSRMIVNYGKRWRSGERISTGFVESTINCFVTKRFSKKQQMQWTAKGAHLLMQIRAKVMNDDLEQTLRYLYPKFRSKQACNENIFNEARIAV